MIIGNEHKALSLSHQAGGPSHGSMGAHHEWKINARRRWLHFPIKEMCIGKALFDQTRAVICKLRLVSNLWALIAKTERGNTAYNVCI